MNSVRVLLDLFSLAIFIAGIGILLVSTIRIPTWKRGVNFFSREGRSLSLLSMKGLKDGLIEECLKNRQ